MKSEHKFAQNYYDVVVIGAGISGMYQLHSLRKIGKTVKVLEAGSDVGGTWYWNRYPGCRFDSESYSYGYSFSEELLEEWDWTEHFSPQPETLKYLQYVAKKFNLKKDIQFNSRVESADYDNTKGRWIIQTEDKETLESAFLITAIGALSEPYVPNFKGKESFLGDSWHTSLWPKEPVDLSNRKVGVIGTGATAVQMITEISKNVGELFVFQLKPEYCVPLGNGKIDGKTQQDIKKRYPEIFEKCRKSFGSFLHDFDDRSALEVSSEEREQLYEELWNQPGFGLWLGNFHDILTSQEANDTVSDFVRRKIKEQIDDPKTAEKLCPKDHGFGTRRVPLESGYYKAYNRPNVNLVDISESSIERITPSGIQTKNEHYELDLIIYATGFDAITGAFKKIEISGENGQKLVEKWADGPSTYLGLQSEGFPNFFTLVGPHNGSTFCNIPRCIEQNVEWVTECLDYMSKNGYTKIEAEKTAEEKWTQHVYEVAEPSLLVKTDSWFVGANVPGKKRAFLMYAGGSPTFRAKCDEIAANHYEGFSLS
ncbi:MAG: NAD(P)/FAD-dependent oxidoreductase [Pseudomonadota bacterium]|nr:NAD(P)/FAD-dependent oxidoreductase [Pseudomonadota bacterium]